MAISLYVSPGGDDRWSGGYAETRADGSDGPFRTLTRAQEAVRALHGHGPLTDTVQVILRGGRYCLDDTLCFTPQDGGTPETKDGLGRIAMAECPVSYQAYPGETPVISGGRRLTGWQVGTLKGKPVWTLHLPEVACGEWYFRQLFVNGERRWRPRLPKKGYCRIAELVDAHFEGTFRDTIMHGSDRFYAAEGDITHTWKNFQDIEITVLSLWMSIHARLQSIDPQTQLVTLDRKSERRMSDDNREAGGRYYLENIFEALDEPGEWYLDRMTGTLYYLPLPGETPEDTEVIAPRLSEVLRLQGEELDARPVAHLHFKGLTFAHAEWWLPDGRATMSQSSVEIPGAVTLRTTRNCLFEGCTFTHMAPYALNMPEACRDIEILGCAFSDLGAGGVKIWHGCTRNTVADCEIGPGGLLFRNAVGILVGKSSGNKLVHNHVHHFHYTGISVGWMWGYRESAGYGNVIEYNHIHDIGQGTLSDMGGIYTLGVATGTRIRFNLIHDILDYSYGGWAIYLDEGSTDILVENNLCYRAHSAGFHQHYGKDNIIRNNIWACNTEHQLGRSRIEAHKSFIFERNIIYLAEGGMMWPGYGGSEYTPENLAFHSNLYYDVNGRPLDFDGLSFAEWQACGLDEDSIIADPQFIDPAQGDYRLRPTSPAFSIGFREFDLSTVGPRPLCQHKPVQPAVAAVYGESD